MLKYVDAKVVFQEIPDEVTLAINLSNCPCHCKGCHSPYLADDIGEVLTICRIEKLIATNKGITTICFMGGDNDTKLINHYANAVRKMHKREVCNTFITDRDIRLPKGLIPKGTKIAVSNFIPNSLKIAWYSGKQELSKDIDLKNFDYIKLGPYIEEKGPLNSRTTNQVMLQIDHSCGKPIVTDITSHFWK